jgi:guanylate kinase
LNDRGDMPAIMRRGLLLVLSSPSGAGKTSVSRLLLEREKNLIISISATTRPKRPAETDGQDYIFVDEAEFSRMVAAGEFLEHAFVFGNYYGTPKAPVEKALAAGHDVMFDVDWQGTQQLMEHDRDGLIRVFLLPPSYEELERRLQTRKQDPKDVVLARMAKAADEMSHYTDYEYVLINRDLGTCVAEVQTILAAERMRRVNQVGLNEFVSNLRGGD